MIALTSLVKDHWIVFRRVLKESQQNADFWDGIIGTTCNGEGQLQDDDTGAMHTSVSAHTTGRASCSEEDDSITKQLDVGQQRRLFLRRELRLSGI